MIQLKMLEHRLLRYLGITAGCLIASCSINLFLVPSHLLTGGATGIAIIVYYLASCQSVCRPFSTIFRSWQRPGRYWAGDIPLTF